MHAADTGYGSAKALAWFVHERGIEPHIPVFDKSKRKDGTFSCSNFVYDHAEDHYTCPGDKRLKRYHHSFATPRTGIHNDGNMRYRASKLECDACDLKP